jgi:hypothetical protein
MVCKIIKHWKELMKMLLKKVGESVPEVTLDVNDFFVGETSIMGMFDLRQVVKTDDGFGILRVSDGELFSGYSKTIEDATRDYKNIKKVKLEEVHYKVL